jgi:3-hydroxyisobutyrate dehydrogenase
MNQPPQNIGYIGMGIMGSAMAANLVRAGFAVTVWNRTASKCQPLVDLGARQANSVAELSAGCDVICTNLTDTPDVEAVLLGSEGVIQHAKPGTIVIDHSTINPGRTQFIAKELAARSITLLDAPVSGGDVGARNGTLSIMVGGDEGAFETVKPVLAAMGKKITHLGPSGSGQTCKACNQIAVLSALQGVCEAIVLAKKSGLDPAKMLDVVGGGAGASWQLTNLGPKILAGDFAPGFMIELALKDLYIVEAAARALSLDLPATRLILQSLQQSWKAGFAKQGTQAIYKTVDPTA